MAKTAIVASFPGARPLIRPVSVMTGLFATMENAGNCPVVPVTPLVPAGRARCAKTVSVCRHPVVRLYPKVLVIVRQLQLNPLVPVPVHPMDVSGQTMPV